MKYRHNSMNQNVERYVSAFLGLKIRPVDSGCPERAELKDPRSARVYCFSGAKASRYCTCQEERIVDCPYRQMF